MSEETITIEKLQQLITQGPFNRWLNFVLVKAGDEGVEMKAAWREEWVVNPDRRYTHGGILAAIIDVAADYAIAARIGRPVPTIDLRVDYHKAASPGDITARARVVRLDHLRQVDQPPQLHGDFRDADGHDRVAGLRGGDQVAHRADAADARHQV